MTLHCLVNQIGQALIDPVFGRGHRGSRQQSRFLVVVGLSNRAGDAHGQCRGGFGFDNHVGQDLSHQRLLRQSLLEGAPMAGVVNRHDHRLARHARGHGGGIKPGELHHFDDGAHAEPLLADQDRDCVIEFDLRRCVRPVAELVLEALDMNRIASAVRPPARHEETR